jgi:hypothetical protein
MSSANRRLTTAGDIGDRPAVPGMCTVPVVAESQLVLLSVTAAGGAAAA